MPSEGGFARDGQGVFVLAPEREPILLEFNAFLKQIASGTIGPQDIVVSRIYTNGERRRAGELRLFARIQNGLLATQDLPVHAPNGILAEGEAARKELRRLEGDAAPNSSGLLTPTTKPNTDARELGRVAETSPTQERTDELPRLAASPDPTF